MNPQPQCREIRITHKATIITTSLLVQDFSLELKNYASVKDIFWFYGLQCSSQSPQRVYPELSV